MTTKKYNAVERLCNISQYSQTFKSVFDAATEHFGDMLDSMTAAQIAAIIEFGYAQHHHGEMNAQ